MTVIASNTRKGSADTGLGRRGSTLEHVLQRDEGFVHDRVYVCACVCVLFIFASDCVHNQSNHVQIRRLFGVLESAIVILRQPDFFDQIYYVDQIFFSFPFLGGSESELGGGWGGVLNQF